MICERCDERIVCASAMDASCVLCALCWERVLIDTALDWGWIDGFVHAIESTLLDERARGE